jgi:hypothetical protein
MTNIDCLISFYYHFILSKEPDKNCTIHNTIVVRGTVRLINLLKHMILYKRSRNRLNSPKMRKLLFIFLIGTANAFWYAYDDTDDFTTPETASKRWDFGTQYFMIRRFFCFLLFHTGSRRQRNQFFLSVANIYPFIALFQRFGPSKTRGW